MACTVARISGAIYGLLQIPAADYVQLRLQ